MRQVVMAAVRDLGYQPDMLAQGLRRGKTFSVGFTVSDIANPVLAEIVTGAEKRLREAGYSLLLTNSEGNPELDVEHISLLARRRVDGLILSLAEENHPETVAALGQLTVPVVLVDRDVPPGDRRRAAPRSTTRRGCARRRGTSLGLGHRRFALITGGPERPRASGAARSRRARRRRRRRPLPRLRGRVHGRARTPRDDDDPRRASRARRRSSRAGTC